MRGEIDHVKSPLLKLTLADCSSNYDKPNKKDTSHNPEREDSIPTLAFRDELAAKYLKTWRPQTHKCSAVPAKPTC